MAYAPSIFFLCAALSLLVALAGLLALGDAIQWVVVVPRWFVYRVFRARFPLMLLALAAFGTALYLGIAERLAPGWVLGLYGAVFAALFFGGFVGTTYVLFPTKQRSARYVPVAEIGDDLLPADAEVLAVEVGGDARAFPVLWILRPHVAGDTVGGEPVVMTYCGLSHLGVACRNELGGAPLDIRVMTQLENNLVLFDAAAEEPIEQIHGCAVDRGRIGQIPSVMMPLRAFRFLYPQGRVFFNPPTGFFDRHVRAMMERQLYRQGGQYDPGNPLPVFRTIDHVDPRVPPKEQVTGVARDGEALAFTLDHLRRHGGAVTDRVGGFAITVKHFPEYGFVDVFEGDVREVDARGFLPDGSRARRVPHASRVLWLIWAHFHRETGVRA